MLLYCIFVIEFVSKEEMDSYDKASWIGSEITSNLLAFDKSLSKLNREEFLLEIKKYL